MALREVLVPNFYFDQGLKDFIEIFAFRNICFSSAFPFRYFQSAAERFATVLAFALLSHFTAPKVFYF